MDEVEDRNKEAAKRKASREATRKWFRISLEALYEKMFANCHKGQTGRCSRRPALICVKSLDHYPSVHCWLSEAGLFPWVADWHFYNAVTSGSRSYEEAVKDRTSFDKRISALRATLR